MTLVLDHLAVTAETLEEGTTWVEERLGVATQPGGQHPVMGTHNRLLGLGPGRYLEIITVDPDAPKPGHARWFGLDSAEGPPRLMAWVARTEDLDAALDAAPAGAGQPLPLSRGDLVWRMSVTDTGHLPFDGLWPGLIEWESAVHPADRLPDAGVRLERLTLSHPDAPALSARLGNVVDVAVEPGPIGMRARFLTPRGPVEL